MRPWIPGSMLGPRPHSSEWTVLDRSIGRDSKSKWASMLWHFHDSRSRVRLRNSLRRILVVTNVLWIHSTAFPIDQRGSAIAKGGLIGETITQQRIGQDSAKTRQQERAARK